MVESLSRFIESGQLIELLCGCHVYRAWYGFKVLRPLDVEQYWDWYHGLLEFISDIVYRAWYEC
ncbi:MAG: hypothetical protein Barrevirus10_7 [Barrevirus sp.]|uniref:Uncharacterized protein n=1 Tax=Barrevirus sp. TaxID=2487763 RepID=A0A3G4ZST3_9VIRU|nr:MAG: hypothetical protein Barrevirus10_7 [Barrevirus sp.]